MSDRKCQDALSSSTSPDPSSSKITAVARVQRNVAEKLRRDKLNGYISELATIVPIVSKAAKRMDKTSILRLSAAYLRICKSPLNGRKKLKSFKWCPNFLNPDRVRDILESVDGFLLVTETSGRILFTSRSVERYLGHQDIDLVGHSLHMFIHPEDVEAVKAEMNKLHYAFSKREGSSSVSRCSFHCRMKEKSQPRSEVQTYQFVHIMGAMTLIEEEDTENSHRKPFPTFKAFIRIMDADPYNQLSLEEAIADEYITRHSLDGTIIFADHRISTITGHMPHEVTGFNAYKYIHTEDISVALFAHHLMFSSDKGTGMIVYRLRTSDERYVYLKSVGCLQYDSSTSQVDHFVCVNQQLNESEGKAQLQYFTDQFIPHIKGSSASSLFESVKALQMSSSKVPSLQSTSRHENQEVTSVSPEVNQNIKLCNSDSKASKGEATKTKLVGYSIKNNSNNPETLKKVINPKNTQIDVSIGPTLVLKTPLIPSSYNEGQHEKSLVEKSEEKPKQNFFLLTQNSTTSRIDNNPIFIREYIYPSAAPVDKSALQSLSPPLVISNSECNKIVVNDESSLECVEIDNFVPSAINSRPSLVEQNSENSVKIVNLHDLRVLHDIKTNISMIEDVSNPSESIYQHNISDAFIKGNLHLLKEFQDDVASVSVSDSSIFVTIPEPLNPDSKNSISVGKSYSLHNMQSSSLDSDDSETITLMSPMCPLRNGLNISNGSVKVSSPNSSTELCTVSLKQFREGMTLHNNLSSLLSSSLPQEENSFSMQSSTSDWNDFYPSNEFLEPLNPDELNAKEKELNEEIKIEMW